MTGAQARKFGYNDFIAIDFQVALMPKYLLS